MAASSRYLPELASTGCPTSLPALLLDASKEAIPSDADPIRAEELYREAQAGCAARGHPLEETVVLLALGGTCLAAGATELSIKSYWRAAEIAQAEDAWMLVSQAWFGVGGAHLTGKNYKAAAMAYRTAAEAAARADIAALRTQALRMAGTCLLLEGSDSSPDAPPPDSAVS